MNDFCLTEWHFLLRFTLERCIGLHIIICIILVCIWTSMWSSYANQYYLLIRLRIYCIAGERSASQDGAFCPMYTINLSSRLFAACVSELIHLYRGKVSLPFDKMRFNPEKLSLCITKPLFDWWNERSAQSFSVFTVEVMTAIQPHCFYSQSLLCASSNLHQKKKVQA